MSVTKQIPAGTVAALAVKPAAVVFGNNVVVAAPAGPAATNATTPTSASAAAPRPAPTTRNRTGLLRLDRTAGRYYRTAETTRTALAADAAELLAAFADDDPDPCRAASELANEWADRRANALLLDAAALAVTDTDDGRGG